MTAPNSREAQIGRLIDAVQARGLTVHAVEVGPKLIKLHTAPALTAAAFADDTLAGAIQSCDEAFGD